MKSRRHLLFSVIYTIPVLITLVLKILSYPERFDLFVLAGIFYTLVLIVATQFELKADRKKINYSFPLKIVFLSFVIFLIVGVILSLVIGQLNMLFSTIPVIISAFLLSTIMSIIPILISLIMIFLSNKKKVKSNEFLDSDFMQ